MITLFIICLVAYLIYSNNKAKQAKLATEIMKSNELKGISDIAFYAQNMNGMQKLLNLSYNPDAELGFFGYSNGRIALKMKSGKSMSILLNELNVKFERYAKYPIQLTLTGNGQKFVFYEMEPLFSKNQWQTIYHILCMAGHSNGSEFFVWDKANRNLGFVNSILNHI